VRVGARRSREICSASRTYVWCVCMCYVGRTRDRVTGSRGIVYKTPTVLAVTYTLYAYRVCLLFMLRLVFFVAQRFTVKRRSGRELNFIKRIQNFKSTERVMCMNVSCTRYCFRELENTVEIIKRDLSKNRFGEKTGYFA